MITEITEIRTGVYDVLGITDHSEMKKGSGGGVPFAVPAACNL